MPSYRFREESGAELVQFCEDDMEAEEAAREWCLGGDYGDYDTTFWQRVNVDRLEIDEDGEEHYVCASTIKVQFDPEEPICPEAVQHDWDSPVDIVGGIRENPGCWGHGGGVLLYYCCMNCGAQKIVDTWAQDPTTGEQGLESVTYNPPGTYELPKTEVEEYA